MDERSQEAYRVWGSDPGDRDAFEHWWRSFMRSEGVEPFEARILASGLFDYSGLEDERGNRVWTHRTTGITMVVVPPVDAISIVSGDIRRNLNVPTPYLIAADRVDEREWGKITGASQVEPGHAVSVTWNSAAGWCEQAKLRLPTHAMWVYAYERGVISRKNTRPEYIQDLHDALLELTLPTNPFIAVGDTTYSTGQWVGGSPADLTFQGFLVSQNLEDDFLEVEKRISAYGLNVGVAREEPTAVTWHDMTGRPRQIEERASPFQEGVQPPSGATPPAAIEDPRPVTGASLLSSLGPPGSFEGFEVSSLLELEEFDLSGAELPLAAAQEWLGEINSTRAFMFISRGRGNVVRVSPAQGRRQRPAIRPVWR